VTYMIPMTTNTIAKTTRMMAMGFSRTGAHATGPVADLSRRQVARLGECSDVGAPGQEIGQTARLAGSRPL
jgi:hypothetical protein